MTHTLIEVVPMDKSHHRQVSELLALGFRDKLLPASGLSEQELILYLNRMLELYPEERGETRVVALLEGTVVGTMAIKRRTEALPSHSSSTKPACLSNEEIRLWPLMKLILTLRILSHRPSRHECYIADLTVHPLHQGKGIGTFLLNWAFECAMHDPKQLSLTLHVAGHNQGAMRLYERHGFRLDKQANSSLRRLWVGEAAWVHMRAPLYESNVAAATQTK
ncbi:GNAT family N-acetyltransferase [Gorillibacterium sp. CAU 1737]|uniref:GNAT family N-acetyltransferase n=1 Tax=Gorillibacterium sp. CAU 1737 TaxID=3140362 RepID=UPI00325FE784